jgi:threonine dehydratase
MLLTEEQKARGVVAASAGNHALALAWHGRDLGVPITCVMPTVAPLTKVSNCEAFGANVVIHGEHIGESKEHAYNDPAYEGMTYINGYDHPHIIAGAGTMGIEILEDVPDVDVVVVPVGGAGLIAGVALAIKTLKPDVQVIGVEPEFCASYAAAVAAGEVVDADVQPTLADGLAVPRVGDNAFEVARHHVDKTVTVSEKQIAIAVLRLAEMEKLVVEGGGAAGIAALLPGGPLDPLTNPWLHGRTVVAPLCGGNIDSTVLGRVIDRGLAADGRLIKFVVTVSDRPGGIADLTRCIAEEGASIKDLMHERAWVHTSISQVQVRCAVETTGAAHVQRLRDRLEAEYTPAAVIWGEDQV